MVSLIGLMVGQNTNTNFSLTHRVLGCNKSWPNGQYTM